MPRELLPCGTRAAYRRHIKNGEPACQACCAAMTEYNRRYRPVPAVRGPYGKSGCGTTAGYSRHKRRREVACQECLAALATYQGGRRAALKARAAT